MKNLSAYISEGIFTQDANLLDEDMVVNAIYDLARTHIKKLEKKGSDGYELTGMNYDGSELTKSKHGYLYDMKLVGLIIFLHGKPSVSNIHIGLRDKEEDNMYGVEWHNLKMFDLEEQIKIYESIKQELESRR